MFFSHCFSVFVHPTVPSALWSDWRQNAASLALTEAWPTLPSFLKHWGQKKIHTQLIFSAHVYFQYTHTKPWKIITEHPKTRSDKPLPTLLWQTSGPPTPHLLWWPQAPTLLWQTSAPPAPPPTLMTSGPHPTLTDLRPPQPTLMTSGPHPTLTDLRPPPLWWPQAPTLLWQTSGPHPTLTDLRPPPYSDDLKYPPYSDRPQAYSDRLKVLLLLITYHWSLVSEMWYDWYFQICHNSWSNSESRPERKQVHSLPGFYKKSERTVCQI